MENFYKPPEKKIKITETELPIRSLIQQRLYERLPIRPDPTRPYVLRLRLRSLVLLGPSCLKLLFMIMGRRRFGSVGATTYLRRQKCVCAFFEGGEAKNAKQQSNNKEKEQNENREKNSKKWYFICERPSGPNYISRARIARTKT